jgi:hypothetical protein
MDPENVKDTQPQEDTKPVETEAKPAEETQTKQDAQPTEQKEATVGDVLGDKKDTKSKKPDAVPFEIFESVKKDLKEIRAELAKKNEVVAPSDLKELADKYDVDVNFINDLSGIIEKKHSSKYEEQLNELKGRDRQAQIDAAFKASFEKSMNSLPEYAGIVNPDIIKKLSLDPENQNKTFTQIIKETYGNAIGGRKTLETARPGEGRDNDTDVDFAKAKTDAAYFSEIMADPAKKKAYNKHLAENVRL